MAKAIVHREPPKPGPIQHIELVLDVEEARYLFRLIGQQSYRDNGPQPRIFDQLNQISELK